MLFNNSILLVALAFPLFVNATDITLETKDKKSYEIEKTISAYLNDERILRAKTNHLVTKLEFEKINHNYKEEITKLASEDKKQIKNIEQTERQNNNTTKSNKQNSPISFDVISDFYLTDLVVFGANGQATLIYNGQEILITTDEHVNGGVLLEGAIKVTDINHNYVTLKNMKTGKSYNKYQQSLSFIQDDIASKNGIKSESNSKKSISNNPVKVSYRTMDQVTGLN